MLEEIHDGFQSLHFESLTLSPIKGEFGLKVVKGRDNLIYKAHNVCNVR
jgi:hypothetical protein